MKKTLPLIILLVIIIAVAIFVFSKSAKIEPTVEVTGMNGSTSTAGTVDFSAGTSTLGFDPNQPIKVQVQAAKEGKENLTFACGSKKNLEVLLHVGGKDPRAEVRMIDGSDKSGALESRLVILKQRTSDTGLKYATDKESIVFTLTNSNVATVVENGQSEFKDCDIIASERNS